MKTGDEKYIYRNELGKACFQYNMGYNFKDMKRRTYVDKVLKDKGFKIASNPNYNRWERGLSSMVYKFFHKKIISGSGIKNETKENHQLANEFYKPIIKKFKETKVYSSFKDNIWGVDLADMQLISKYNKGIRYLLCAIDLFNKYVFVVPLKHKKELLLLIHFRVF